MVKLICSKCSYLFSNLSRRSYVLRGKLRSLSVPIYPMSNQELMTCKVVEIYKLSKSVQGLKLLVENPQFNFKAGQWVDFYVPGLTQVAGYSICSSPEYFKDTRLIELAVKYSKYPPTIWVHNECTIDSQVQISLGGDLHFDVDDHCGDKVDLLLVAGGVGINPLLSVFRHVARRSVAAGKDFALPRVLLIYCASRDEGLIFKDSIIAEVSALNNLSCEFITTSPDHVEDTTVELGSSRIKFTSGRRLNRESLETRLKKHFGSLDRMISFICGPYSMIDDINADLLKIGLSEKQIKFEKWW